MTARPTRFASKEEWFDWIRANHDPSRPASPDDPDEIRARLIELGGDPDRPEQRLTILANSDVSRGKYAAAAVHAALYHYGIDHGAVIVLGARAKDIESQCSGVVIYDAGRTEVAPGTVTAGVRDEGTTP